MLLLPLQLDDAFSSLPSCSLKDFKVDRVLGTGSFGRVSLAQHIATGRICAIKALSKANIVRNQQVCLGPHSAACGPLHDHTTVTCPVLQHGQRQSSLTENHIYLLATSTSSVSLKVCTV